ncbi:MAG: RidA family protein [Alphaproteobacteria bacterium]|nr:RidA family protein [Alphaproteobacteria bacterium]
MNRIYNPDGIAAPAGAYSHGVEAPANARTLYIAGQIGVNPDGSISDSAEDQADRAWQNIVAILADAGMGVEDLVRMTTYITRAEDALAIRAVRTKYLGDYRPASTLLVVAALAQPEYVFELEAVAAKA